VNVRSWPITDLLRTKMKSNKTVLNVLFSLMIILCPFMVVGQDIESKLLDGATIEYTYTDGGAVILTFYDRLLKFEWVAGPNAGAAGEDFTFRTHEISDDTFQVNWQMSEEKNFVTLTFNLESGMMYGSTIMGYGTDQEFLIFDEAVITRVEF